MWSFGHLVILPFYALLLDLSFISWLKIGFVAYLMKRKNRAGGNEKEVSTCSVLFIYYLFPYPLSPDRFLKRGGELVRTACAFRATLNALETGDHVFCLLAFDQ